MHAYHGLISLINFTQYQTCFILQINASFYAYSNIADMKKGAIEDALVTTSAFPILPELTDGKMRDRYTIGQIWGKISQRQMDGKLYCTDSTVVLYCSRQASTSTLHVVYSLLWMSYASLIQLFL